MKTMFRSIRPPGPHQTVCYYIDLFNCFVLRGEQKGNKPANICNQLFLKKCNVHQRTVHVERLEASVICDIKIAESEMW